MSSKRIQLAKELQAAGATGAEINDLLPIASRLSQLRREKTIENTDQVEPRRRLRALKPAAWALSGLVLGALLIIMSQSALPTSVLYPVQELSDGIAISLSPQYRAIIMMKRAQQVNQLVADHASQAAILATLDDYTTVASTYRSSPHADYAAFEFCETNLQQAASAASPPIRSAIAASLRSLDST